MINGDFQPWVLVLGTRDRNRAAQHFRISDVEKKALVIEARRYKHNAAQRLYKSNKKAVRDSKTPGAKPLTTAVERQAKASLSDTSTTTVTSAAVTSTSQTPRVVVVATPTSTAPPPPTTTAAETLSAEMKISADVISTQGSAQVTAFSLPCIVAPCSSISTAANQNVGCSAVLEELAVQNIDVSEYTCSLVCTPASDSECAAAEVKDSADGAVPSRLRRAPSGATSDLTFLVVGFVGDSFSDSTTVDISITLEDGVSFVLGTAPLISAEVVFEPHLLGGPFTYSASALKELIDSVMDAGDGDDDHGDGSETVRRSTRYSGGEIAGIVVGTCGALAALFVVGAFYFKPERSSSLVYRVRRSMDLRRDSYVVAKRDKDTLDAKRLVAGLPGAVDDDAGVAQREPIDMDPTSKTFRTKSSVFSDADFNATFPFSSSSTVNLSSYEDEEPSQEWQRTAAV